MLAKEIKFIERFKARASHAAQVQSRVKKLDKIEKRRAAQAPPDGAFEFRRRRARARTWSTLKGVHKGYGRAGDLRGLDFQVRRKERWCVMGVNGAGKSTLLKLVAGATEPDEGTVTLGASVKMGYFAQHAMDLLDGDDTCSNRWRIRSRRPGRARCGRSPAASASPATMSRRSAACCRAARRRGW
jgi:ATPase subunit of ABC transporter with duplicated ATPase domains